jgi:hypothetical protein
MKDPQAGLAVGNALTSNSWQLQYQDDEWHEGGQVQPTALLDFYCTISLETSKIILQYHQSGDVHIAVYDFDGEEMYLAIGKININGKYNYSGNDGLWCAYEPRTGNM